MTMNPTKNQPTAISESIELSNDIIYHEDNAHESKMKGYEGSYHYHCEMSDMLQERAEFYRRYPTRAGRRSARKENIRVGRYY